MEFLQNKFQFNVGETGQFDFEDDMSSVSSHEDSIVDDDNAFIIKKFEDLERKIIDQGNAPFELNFRKHTKKSTVTQTSEINAHNLRTITSSSLMMTPSQMKHDSADTPSTELYNAQNFAIVNNSGQDNNQDTQTPQLPYSSHMLNFPSNENNLNSSSVGGEALLKSNKSLVDTLQNTREEQIHRYFSHSFSLHYTVVILYGVFRLNEDVQYWRHRSEQSEQQYNEKIDSLLEEHNHVIDVQQSAVASLSAALLAQSSNPSQLQAATARVSLRFTVCIVGVD
jgi:hypothetical protein